MNVRTTVTQLLVRTQFGVGMPGAGFARDVAVVGGCGRVGLPLGIAFAARGLAVTLVDRNRTAVDVVNAGRMPFREDGAHEMLESVAPGPLLLATTDQALIRDAECVLIVVGTPLDDHLNPDLSVLPRIVAECAPYLVEGQLVVLRSTVHPGATALVEREVAMWGVNVDVAFCPERIAEGRAMTELFDLPQIVGARDARVRARARALFANLTGKVVELDPEEAELAKLFTNTWRYVKFATANQFWMMANDAGLDFERIRHAVISDYPRAADLPGAGFAAGPCLLKDTMQLAAFSGNDFVLGHAAMMVNEGLPLYVVRRIESRYNLSSMTVGILGMAFKGGSDDPRDSLSYKLRKLFAARAAVTVCSDVHIVDDRFVTTEQLLHDADLIVLAAPHAEYRDLDTAKPVVDVWGITGRPPVI